MYERAKDSAKEMMDTVIDKLTPNKKEKSYPTLGKDDEDDSHLKPGPYNAKDVHVIHSSTLPKYKSETDGSYVSSTNATVGSDTTTLNSNYDAQQASTLSAYMLAKNKREIELEKENKMAREKAEKLEIMEQDREKEWEREQEKEREREEANLKAEEETLLYPNMDPIPVNAANSSVINTNSLKSSQFSKVIMVAIDS